MSYNNGTYHARYLEMEKAFLAHDAKYVKMLQIGGVICFLVNIWMYLS